MGGAAALPRSAQHRGAARVLMGGGSAVRGGGAAAEGENGRGEGVGRAAAL